MHKNTNALKTEHILAELGNIEPVMAPSVLTVGKKLRSP